MNLLLWTPEMNDDVAPLCEELKGLGYDGVEIPLLNVGSINWADWGRRLDDMGLARTAVTIASKDANPISPDAKIRAAGRDHHKRVLDACAAVGAPLLCGPLHSALGEFTGKGPTADEWKWGVETMREVATHAASVNVVVALEALNRFECYFLNCMTDTARFVGEVSHAHLRAMYDTFHAHMEEKSIRDAIDAIAPFLAHVHISENDRSTPGSGQVRWPDTFEALRWAKYNSWMVVEAFGLALPELAAATKIWRRMYKDEMSLADRALRFMKTRTNAPR